MARLENDMTDRMCGTGNNDSEKDLDRDMPDGEVEHFEMKAELAYGI